MIKIAYNPKVSFKLIREVVCGTFDISDAKFRSRSNKSDIRQARYIAWLIAHHMTGASVSMVAMQLDGRSAQTVSDGITIAREHLKADSDLVFKLIDIVRVINECANINNETFKAKIEDPDPKAIALKALSAPDGEFKISKDELLAVLRFAAIAPPLMPVFFDSHDLNQR